MKKPRIAILISGSGTNLQALIDAVKSGRLSANIVVVISNRKAAFGLERAKKANIPTRYLPFKPYREVGKSREEYDVDLARLMAEFEPDLIVLAGWMRILTAVFLNQFPMRVINLHPALPGHFVGTNAIARAFAAFQRSEVSKSGCMVHYAIPQVDAGPVIDTRTVPFQADDTLQSFAARLHAAEHELIVKATQKALDSIHYSESNTR